MARRKRKGQTPKPYKERERWKFKYRIDQAQQDGTVRRVQKTKVLARVDQMTYTEASREARKFVRPIDDMVPGIEYHDRTVNQLIEGWRESIRPTLKRSTQESYEWAIKRISPRFGGIQVAAINTADVQSFLTFVARELSPISARDLRAHLSGLFSVAVDWNWIDRNPARGRLRLPPRVPVRKKRILTPEEFRALALELPQPYRAIVVVMVLCGLRSGEVAALRWRNILPGSLLIEQAVYRGQLSSPKHRYQGEELPCGPVARRYLEEWRGEAKFKGPDDFVFAIRRNTPIDMKNVAKRRLKPAAAKVGIGSLSWHDLRHTFATLGRRAGVSPEVMRRLMRHKNIQTTLGIYSHLDRDTAPEVAFIEAFAWPESNQGYM